MELSIVTTLYRSARYVGEFHRRISAVAMSLAVDYEIIFVNDGSPDDSISLAKDLIALDSRVTIIDLSRNFGHHRAMMCGLQQAKGDLVFLIDVDLEEAPESLINFWHAMKSDPEADLVYGQLIEKKAPIVRRLLSETFYLLFNFLSNVKLDSRQGVSRLMTRAYVDALVAYSERELFFPAIWEDVGFRQIGIPITKTFDGFSTYTLRKRLSLAIDAVLSFSSKPLVFVFYTGFLISTGAMIFLTYLIYRKYFIADVALGWTSLVAVQFLLGGIIIFILGLIGIYIAKIYNEVKARPQVIVRRIYQAER